MLKSVGMLLLLLLSCPVSYGFQQAFVRSANRRMVSSSLSSAEMGNLEASLFEQSMDLDRVVMTPDSSSRNAAEMLKAAESQHGMPWSESIGAKKDGVSPPLLYMPFWEWQMSFMKENLTNLRVLPCSAANSTAYPLGSRDLSYSENAKKGARIVNLCFTCSEYSKIRMTYYDAGEGVQVFNSLWYPHESHNVPLLGIDLLSFNRKKYLGIVDFQPIHDDNKEHSTPQFEEEVLKPIRDKYPALHGKMSAKFYDETKFFSRQMLFARFEDEGIVEKDLLPAFKDYVSAHVDLVKTDEQDYSNMDMVKQRHAAYDTYSADRDPATGLFAAMFGKDWADEFVYGFLFAKSEKPEEGKEHPAGMMMGGPPPQHQKKHQQQPAQPQGKASPVLA